jgi:hypothetical protein
VKTEQADERIGSDRYLENRFHGKITKPPGALSISSNTLLIPDEGRVAVAVHRDKKLKITGFLDALHWLLQTEQEAVTYMFFTNGADRAALDAIRTLHRCLKEGIRERVTIEAKVEAEPACLADCNGAWLASLMKREESCIDGFARAILTEVERLARATNENMAEQPFRWYRTVSDPTLRGRVWGLEICRMSKDGQAVVFDVGKPGKGGKIGPERARFLEICRGLGLDRMEFRSSELDRAVLLIHRLTSDRASGRLSEYQPEHRLEARVLQGAVPVYARGDQLVPVVEPGKAPFQFPTRWSRNERTRYVDALMRLGEAPWVVELKIGSEGEYYRHSIGQALLYREFIRVAADLQPWFERRGLRHDCCEAAVAFPKMKRANAERIEHCRALSNAFRDPVDVIELERI